MFDPDVQTVRYEKLVEDSEAELRPIVAALGLDWRADMLDHQTTAAARGVIMSASYAQVTEPIYSSFGQPVGTVPRAPGAHPAHLATMDRKVRLYDLNMSEGLIDRADRAAASGDLREAERCLAEAAESQPEPTLFLKLAGLQRAIGEVQAALDSVERALAMTPRELTALLLRASLLEKLERAEAPQAWSNALASRPAGELPPHLQKIVAEAERKVEQWTEARAARMKSVMAAAELRADPEERRRIDRFRSNVLRRTRHYHSEPTDFHFSGASRN